MDTEYNVVIVGAGSAGCVLAGRLSAESSRTVLLIEAGGDLAPGAEPADVRDTFASSYYNKAYMWPDLTAHWRQRHNSPAVPFDQARVMGGGSSVMGMVALRGTPADFDEWEALGAAGWGWRDVLPCFRKLETDLDFMDEMHGDRGPIPVRRTAKDDWPPLTRAIDRFAREQELPHVADMNGDFRDGYGSLPMSNTRERRGSTAMGYLDATVRSRANLTIMTGAAVTGIRFDGRRAIGVTVADRGGTMRDIGAREVVVSAGGIFSPALLLRSGIGPAAELAALGIAPRADLSGVGRNLQNHPLLFVAAHLKRGARQPRAIRPHPMTCFRYSSGLPGAPPSDMFIAAHSKSSWNALGAQIANFNATLFKPRSRGRVALRSADPREHPLIEFNFLDDELDLLRLADGVRRVIALASCAPVRSLCTAVFPVRFTDRIRRLNRLTRANAVKTRMIAAMLDLVPGLSGIVFGRLTGARVDLGELLADREALHAFVRANVAGTFHVCGTCRIGRADDPAAVVDPAGRVRGIGGLRVVDASIMPTVTRGNTNLPTIMLAEKLAAEMGAAPAARPGADGARDDLGTAEAK